ncbi:MAG: pimeloyl-ACP methyl ester esterase BioH [Arenimonas sp.]|nr:pimeloyl-ACP methyl ester esterase BioH [Arenimonas sp.]
MPELQIAKCGSGPALVMLHGWAMHGGVFTPLVTRLQQEFTLYLVDLPGHGHSADSSIALELDACARQIAMQTPRALWLGWSLGGLVALHAAQRLPDSVRGLVMICASARFVRADDWPQGMDDSVFHGFADALARDYRGTIDRFLLLEAQGSDHVRDDVRLLRQQVFAFGEPSREKLGEGLAVLQDSDLRAGLPSMEMPSLWIAGRRDRLVSPPAMQACAQAARHGQFARIEGGGHAPFLTHGDEVANAIRQFAQALPA